MKIIKKYAPALSAYVVRIWRKVFPTHRELSFEEIRETARPKPMSTVGRVWTKAELEAQDKAFAEIERLARERRAQIARLEAEALLKNQISEKAEALAKDAREKSRDAVASKLAASRGHRTMVATGRS